MPEPLYETPRDTLRPTDKCHWCGRPGTYTDGTQCKHAHAATALCPVHGRFTDINLVTRGRRAVVKCAHYDTAFVVLYADPSADSDPWGTYTLQFAMRGVGQELYTLPAKKGICPHACFDSLVRDMRAGVRPSQNRVPLAPDAQNKTAKPGESLDADA